MTKLYILEDADKYKLVDGDGNTLHIEAKLSTDAGGHEHKEKGEGGGQFTRTVIDTLKYEYPKVVLGIENGSVLVKLPYTDQRLKKEIGAKWLQSKMVWTVPESDISLLATALPKIGLTETTSIRAERQAKLDQWKKEQPLTKIPVLTEEQRKKNLAAQEGME